MFNPLRLSVQLVAALMMAMLTVTVASAQEKAVLFQKVQIFDGRSAQLSRPQNVLVRGNKIEKISAEPIPVDKSANTTVINGEKRTLMPGLIDNHWHTTLVRPSVAQAISADVGYLNLLASVEATATLMRGFTTVRDVGGPSFGLKRAIDEGLVPGPRIYPSGAMITITGGHGDFRQEFEVPRSFSGPLFRMEQMGGSLLADSPDQVRVRTRELLMLGASQIKLTAGGGVASPFSPLDATTFTEAELRAAVEAAENWGTYVTVHAYTSQSAQRAIQAGVKCIEHGNLMDDATAKLMAERGIWLSAQPFPPEFLEIFPPGSSQRAKIKDVIEGAENTYRLARMYKIKTAFGTDILFSPNLAPRQGAMLASLARWFQPAEVLTMGTHTNAQLLQLSGKRNPYPGKLGVVEEGALADLLVVNGNPLENIELITDPVQNFLVIMKDGTIVKNTGK